MSALAFRTRIVVDEIIAQLESRQAALRGVEVTIITTELAYRRGKFVVKKTGEERRTLGEEQSLDDLDDGISFLTNSTLRLEELPGGRQNEVRIRARSVTAKKFDFANFTEDNFAVTLIMNRVPARLLRMKIELVNLPWWFKWVIKSMDTGVEFDYIRGIPVPKNSCMRLLSRGIGSWRWGMGEEMEVHYGNL